MALAAARAIADVVGEDALNASVIVPSVFDARVAPSVAAAVRAVAKGTPPGEAAAGANSAGGTLAATSSLRAGSLFELEMDLAD
jgi:malate dehydrogenase (oxaloacetate-decarboxylating)